MIDKIRIILEDARILEEKTKGYYLFGRGRKNPDVKAWRKYIVLDKEKQKDFYEDDDIKDVEKELKKHQLKVTLNVNEKIGKTQLIIEGSIRKWYHGKDFTIDLKKKQFVDCIDSLAREVGIEDKSLWNAKVTKLETGVSLKLKDEHRGIVNCIFNYRGFRKNTYDRTGVEFKGKNYDVIFYDQLRRIYNQRRKKKKQYDKLALKNFIFRFEIQAHKVSGVPMFEGKLDTLLKIKSNWKYIGENLLKVLDKVKFVNTLSPEIYVELKNGATREIKSYLAFKGIEKIGVENFRILVGQLKTKHRGEIRDKIIVEDYEYFLEKNETDYKQIFSEIMERKIRTL